MKFPFPEKKEYIDLFNKLGDEEKALYNIALFGIVFLLKTYYNFTDALNLKS